MRLDYGGEVIYEGGTVGTQSIGAWAAQAGAAYQFLNVATKPRVFTQYDYASGNSNPATTQSTPPSTRFTRQPTTALASPTSSAGRTLSRCAWAPPLSLTGGSA
jgi:hypothetical protein